MQMQKKRAERVLCRTLIFTMLLAGTEPILAQITEADKQVQLRSSLEKWVETQQIISKEKQDLVLSREILNDRINLVKKEIESVREKVKSADESIAQADHKRVVLQEDYDKLEAATDSLAQVIIDLETELKLDIDRMPPLLAERIRPLSQRLPEFPNNSKLSLSERFQNVIGILNEADKFNREIMMAGEVRTLPDGSSVEVTAVYLGLGQGYYVNGRGDVAGTGTPHEKNWQWQPDNEIAAAVSDMVAILKNEKIASYVQVPVDIK